MLAVEEKYAFRKRLDDVHPAGIRDVAAVRQNTETAVDETWRIAFEPDTVAIAQDLQDYFLKSMDMALALTRDMAVPRAIRLRTGAAGASPRGYDLSVTADCVMVSGVSVAGCQVGAIALEDALTFRKAPYLERQSTHREPMFSPRMVHSGWGLDQFPDSHLNAIVHAGFDSILIFVKGPNWTTHGYMDFNDLIDRAERYSLGVYFYSYLPSFKHPDDADAEAFFEASYGEVFRRSPKARGLILVGESCCFPSKDPRCNGLNRDDAAVRNNNSDHRPFPGFFPCSDYPQWLNAVKKAVHAHSPHAELIFWSYNWGREPADIRTELIRALPKDTVLEATFEMNQVFKGRYPNHTALQPDYSITFPGPSDYFVSEAECARQCGLKLYTMSNTAGRTWDFGCVPYMPFPQQWMRRFAAMKHAHDAWGLAGIMDSHHYGWYPSVISELAKAYFSQGETDCDAVLRKILVRDFGASAALLAAAAYQKLSDAMDSYTPGFDDQAGPLRCGPAFPFIFQPILYPHNEQKMDFPTTPESAVGGRWIHLFYQPEHLKDMSWSGLRFREDIRIMTAAKTLWDDGLAMLRQAVAAVPADRRDAAERTLGVAEFCYRSFLTMLHTKRWWLANKKLEIEDDVTRAQGILDGMAAIIADERENALAAIPLAERDSSLGWEPSMDYVADAEHIRWKLAQLERVRATLDVYRKTVAKDVYK